MQKRIDVHQAVTDQILAAIEAGVATWQMPWHRTGEGLNRPTNIDTGNAYRGVNVVALWASAQMRGYSNGIWGTYRQWANQECQVRKGEKASLIVFYKELDITREGTQPDEQAHDTVMFARASWVFNADQVDGYQPAQPAIAPSPVANIEAADCFIRATGADIRHGGTRAFYRHPDDFIQMPERERFLGSATTQPTEAYYATLLHELTHWTGHERRCDRQFGERFGDQAYSMEELVAELGAAFLCTDLGITAELRPDHAQYIDHWLKVMKADKKAIFTAAAQAAKAAHYLQQLQPLTRLAAA
ncbi:MAG: peptidase [Hyphomicrobium sp.]|nr:peptidase [Hyphomicrobium sp.]